MPSGPISASRYGRWSRPTAWWWVIVPPEARIARDAASFAPCHCLSRIGGERGDDGEVERGAGRVDVRDVAQHDRLGPGRGERLAERGGDRGLEGRELRPGRRGLERLGEHADVEERVAQSRRREPAALPGAGGLLAARDRRRGRGRPRPAPIASASAAAASAPSNVATARHPRIRVKCPPRAAFDAGLGLVAHAQDGGTDAALRRFAEGRGGGGEVGERPRAVRRDGRYRPDPDGDLGQHAEGALRAEEQLSQVGAGGARGCAPELQVARRGSPPAARARGRRTGRTRGRPGRSTASRRYPPSEAYAKLCGKCPRV